MKRIAILGSTGSIGTQTLEVVENNQDIQVTALAAGSNIRLLEEQIRKFHPTLACVWDEKKAAELRTNIADLSVKVVSGMDGLLEVAVQPEAEILVTAIVGMIGIRPTSHEGRKGHCTGKQGDSGHCRTYHHAPCKRGGCEDPSGGQ